MVKVVLCSFVSPVVCTRGACIRILRARTHTHFSIFSRRFDGFVFHPLNVANTRVVRFRCCFSCGILVYISVTCRTVSAGVFPHHCVSLERLLGDNLLNTRISVCWLRATIVFSPTLIRARACFYNSFNPVL